MTNPTPDFDPSGQAIPGADAPAPSEDGGGGIFGRIRQAVIDNYNGLYKIVLEPSMPKKYQVGLIVFGAILGLIWGWGLYPAEFTGANPNRMNQPAQDQWIRLIAVASSDSKYNSDVAIDLVSRVPAPAETIQRLLNDPNLSDGDRDALQNLLSIIPTDLVSADAPAEGGLIKSILQTAGLLILITVITPIWMLLYRLLIYPNIVAAIIDRLKRMTNKEYAEQKRKQAQELAIQRQQRAAVEAMKQEQAADVATMGEPVMQKLAIYTEGRHFDESYEIELPLDQGGDFLGQSGAVIAEAVEPDPIAIEVWLFDMFSSQEIKKVFVTEAGNNDPGIRGRLEGGVANPATDIVVATPGATLDIASDKITLRAKMSSVETNANGRYASFNLQMQAWQADGGGASASAPSPGAAAPPPLPQAAPLPDYSDFEFDPPPQMPGQSAPPPAQPLSPPPGGGGLQPPPQQPLGGGLQPPQPPSGGSGLQPPPSSPPPPSDDDPFGGTGDFTPLSNN